MTITREINVNESIAKLFYDQCMGSTSGHMANIPNSPILSAICLASGVVNENDFKQFLIDVSEELDGGNF